MAKKNRRIKKNQSLSFKPERKFAKLNELSRDIRKTDDLLRRNTKARKTSDGYKINKTTSAMQRRSRILESGLNEFAPSRPTFNRPTLPAVNTHGLASETLMRKTRVCHRRSETRKSLFALGHAGSGISRPKAKIFTPDSKITCKR